MNVLLPVYYQIKQTIRGWILNKEFGPGEKIPSENELAEKFNVSRLTVRQAISHLVQEGLLVAKRGGGTFVTNNHNLIKSLGLEFNGFMDDLFYQVRKSKAKFVEMARVPVSRLLKERLKLANADEEVFEIKRVRIMEGKPFAYTINYLPLDIGNKINKKDLYKRALLQIMEEDLGIHFSEAFQTIEASFANPEVAHKLKIVSGSPILYVERIMYGQKGEAVEFVQSSYRGDLYKYIVRLRNVPRKDKNIWVHQSE